MLKKIIFTVCAAMIAAGSAFADSTSIPGVRINWTTDIPAHMPSNQKQTAENPPTKTAAILDGIRDSATPKNADLNAWLPSTNHFYFLKNWRQTLERLVPLNDQTTIVDFFNRFIKKASDMARSAFQDAKTKILNAVAKKIKSL